MSAPAWTAHPGIVNLATNQTQLDADGCMVGVSRQAVEETLAVAADLAEALGRCHAVLNYVSQWGAGSFDRAELADVGAARDIAAAALAKARGDQP